MTINGVEYKQVRLKKKDKEDPCFYCVGIKDMALCEVLAPCCRFDSVFMRDKK